MSADHPQRVAKWLAEVFGGPKQYTTEYGGYPRMLSQHVGKCLTEDHRTRWVALLFAVRSRRRVAKRCGVPVSVQRLHRVGVAPRGRELPDRRQTTRTHADALQTAADDGPGVASSDPLADLTAELTDFQRGVSRRGRISLVGTMLQESTAPDLLKHYRARGIAPRRKRIRPILERAQQLGLIDSDADLEVAVTLCTGSWYARARRFAAPRSLASRYGLSDELAGGPR